MYKYRIFPLYCFRKEGIFRMKDCAFHASIPNWKYPVEISHNSKRVVDPNHNHNFLQIFHMNSGTCSHCVGEYSTTLTSRAVSILPAGYPHYTDARYADNNLYLFNLTDRLFQDAPENPRSFSSLCIKPLCRTVTKKSPIIYPSVETSDKMKLLLGEMHTLLKNHSVEKLPIVRGKTVELMTLLAGEYILLEGSLYGSTMSSYCPSINVAFNYIHNNYTEQNLSVEDVARASMMSVRSFHRLFKEIMGMPFMHYVKYLRIRRAKELLAETDRILSDISSACGFIDITTFHRLFKMHTGFTPREYRIFVQNTLCAYPMQ